MLKTIGLITATIFGAFAHIYVGMVAWNLFMPHYGMSEIDFKQAWIFGIVVGSMSGASRVMTAIKKEAKEGIEVLAACAIILPFVELFILHVIHWAAF